MKTKQLFVLALLCAPITIFSQGFYLGIGGGYGFPAAKQTLADNYKSTNSATSSTDEAESNPMSLGKGVNAGLYAGYAFNKNTSAEIGFSYLIGSPHTFTNENINTTSGSSSKSEDTWKARMFRIVPALRITAGEKKLRPYVKAGFIIGVGGKMYSEYNNTSSGPGFSNTIVEKWEYSGGLSTGFHGAMGLNFMVSNKIGIFAEIAGNYQSWAMSKGVMTEYTVNGQDQMGTLDRIDKEIEFVESYSNTYSGSSSPDPNQPDVSTRFFLPMSSLGFNFGVHISFGKSE